MASRRYNPDKEIPDLTGKVIFITGGTAGIGAGSVEELSKHNPSQIFFSGRNERSAEALKAKISPKAPNVKITFLKCDISSFASVKSCAETIKASTDRLDILMLNAGIMAVDAGTSVDGYEIQWATNQMGHALLVKLLLPLLKRTAELEDGNPRVVNLSSIAYQQAPKQGIAFDTLKSKQEDLGSLMLPARWARYGQTKLAQLLYTEQLAAHHPEITFVSVHPGVILTGLFENVGFAMKLPVLIKSMGKKTPVEEGHWHQCWAATVRKEQLRNGEYYEPIGVVGVRTTRQARDKELGRRLWDWTEKELSAYE